MDLLSSLNLHVLPEQQTRINDKISTALKANPNIRLGFDACCNCAKPLKGSDKEDVCCKGCGRVWYCSKKCRREDAENHNNNEEEQARGHSAIICSLLRLCNIDEEMERKEVSSPSSKNNKKCASNEEKEAAIDRISSEYESYPATLANVLLDAPCFKPTLDKFIAKRRGKTTRQSDLEDDNTKSNHTLTIHIIGASEESELWGDFQLGTTDAVNAYTEALGELVSTFKGLRKINLAFIGPNCPSKNLRFTKTIDDVHIAEEMTPRHESGSGSGGSNKRKRDEEKKHHHTKKQSQVVIETYRHNYELKNLKMKENHSKKKSKHSSSSTSSSSSSAHQSSPLSKPDIVVFFNPGFTCPDYDWNEALKACQNCDLTTKTPFIITTNTEMEAIADIQFLHQHGYIDSLPSMVADIVNEGKLDHDDDTFDRSENDTVFFGENINAGNRVRQSGNMANDLFCKNNYIFGGHFSHGEARNSNSSKKTEEIKAKSSSSAEQKSGKSKPVSNSKKNNAALM